MGNQGENARLTVFGKDGKPAEGAFWANPSSREMQTVDDYRVLGYRIVHPKEVETLPGGTFRPENKDFGVLFEFDRQKDRVTTKGGMTLMYASEDVRKQMADQQGALRDLYHRRGVKTEKVRGGADNGGADLETQEQTTTQGLMSD